MTTLEENHHDGHLVQKSKNLRSTSASRGTVSNPGEEEMPVSLNEQSFLFPGPERIHVSMLENSELKNFTDPFYLYPDVRTGYDLIRKGLARSNNGNCLGYRPDDQSGYIWLSYQTVIDRSVNFGCGLRHLGVKEKEHVGIYSNNRVEWELAQQGLYSFSMVSVALYDTLGPTASHYIITQAEITTVVLETEKNLLSILEKVPTCLKTIIYMNDLSSDAIFRAEKLGLNLYKFSQVEAVGQEQRNVYPEKPPKPEDIATLSYTSGTTGTPKGVIMTHSSVVSTLSCTIDTFTCFFPEAMTKDDIVISFLPLAHAYQKCLEAMAFMEGASIGFWRGNILTLLDDIKVLKPTIFPTVPRLLCRVYDKVMGAVNQSSLKRLLVKTALHYKGKELEQNIRRRNSIWDYLVFGKIQEALGGRVRIIISGGSPINAEVLQFFRCALGCLVMEAYGQTESIGLVTMTLPNETKGGHVGPPILGVALKLVDVPEMNYYSQNDQGELCIKSSGICKGYYKNEEETQKVIDEDGWLHTGDIATWLPNGTIKIIDRKKSIFKLSQGEYVAPEKIEIIYAFSRFVTQIFIYGDSLEAFVVGIVVPDAEILREMYPAERDIPSLCKDPNVKTMILSELTKLGRDNGLHSFEQVKDIYLHPDPFTTERGLLTPTMKLKRPELKKFFEPQIKQMYSRVRK